MDHLLWSLVPWGYQVLLDLEAVRSGPLNVLLSIVTDLGSNLGYLVVLSFVYWCIDKRAGQGLAYSSLISATINIWLKHMWSIPRPDSAALEGVLQKGGIGRRVTPLRESTLPSFPSGHAQGAAVTWGYVAHWVRAHWVRAHRASRVSHRKRWVWPAAGVLIGLIAFSRVYLGVHFPQDVIAGLAIGTVYLVVWLWAEPRVRAWLAPLSIGWRLALAVAPPLALLAVQPGEDTAAAVGAVMGLGVGYVLEGRTLGLSVAGPWRQRVLRAALGLMLTIAVYFGLRALFGLVRVEGGLAFCLRTLRYGLVGLAAAWGVPWVLIKCRLAQVEKNRFCVNRST